MRWDFEIERAANAENLGPRLPHHRHPMTADELLAGIIVWTVVIVAAVYIGWYYF